MADQIFLGDSRTSVDRKYVEVYSVNTILL